MRSQLKISLFLILGLILASTAYSGNIGAGILGPTVSFIGQPEISGHTVTGTDVYATNLYINGVTSSTAYWTTNTDQTLLTGNKSGSFDLSITGTVSAEHLSSTDDAYITDILYAMGNISAYGYIIIHDGLNLEINDPTNTNFVQYAHDGTDATIFTDAGNIRLHNNVAGNGTIIQLGDNDGTAEFSIRDSTNNIVVSIDSDGNLTAPVITSNTVSFNTVGASIIRNYDPSNKINFLNTDLITKGRIDLGDAVLEIPNATAPTVDATGEMALDTNVITQGLIKFYSTSALTYIVATTDTPGDNEVPTYDAVSGTIAWEAGGGGGGANTALSNLAAVAINTSLISDITNTDDFGTDLIRWKDLYLSGYVHMGVSGDEGTFTYQTADNTWNFTGDVKAMGFKSDNYYDTNGTQVLASSVGVRWDIYAQSITSDVGETSLATYNAGGSKWTLFNLEGAITTDGTITGSTLTDGTFTTTAGALSGIATLDFSTPSTGWSVSNVSSDTTFDADSTSLDEIADIVGTMINALKGLGIYEA